MLEFRQFASPHVHPQSLDSASTPAAFAAREVALGGVALTCTDHGTLQASYPIYELARKKKLIPVIGLESYFRDDDDAVLKRLGVERTVSNERWAPEGLSYADYLKYTHLTMHFRDYDAYLCAVRLLSKADLRAEQHGSERKPLFAWSDVEEIASHNATAGSGCLIGMVSRHLLQHQDRDAADAYFERLHHLFGDRFYVELFPHVCSHNWSQAVYVTLAGDAATEKFYFGKNLRVRDADHPGRAPVEVKADGLEAVVKRIGEGAELVGVKHNRRWADLEPRRIVAVRAEKGFIRNDCSVAAPEGDVQWGVNMYLRHLAEKHGVRVLVSDDSHFATPEEHAVQDIRLSSPHHTWKMHNSYHRFSSAEAWDYFRDRMGVDESTFRGWIDNSLEWAEGFRGFKFDSEVKLPTNFYPEDTLSHTIELVTAHGRMSDDDAYRERLGEEIDLLHANGTIDLLPYFMIDEEVVRVYRNQGWLTGPGRGSAAGLYLSYLFGITHVDPIRYKLSLERFITPDRIEAKKMPDIDQDLPFREPLEGWEVDVVEFTAQDGTSHVLPEVWKLETPAGLLTVDEAVARGVPVFVWWRKSDTKSTETLAVTRRSRTDKTLPRWFPGWFKERFGGYISQVSVDSTLKLRAAVRDVARQRHGFVPPDVEDLVKQFEEAPQGLEEVKFVLGYSDDQGEHAGSIATDKALQQYAARYPEDFKVVTKCLGLARHRSQHPCAFVLGDRPISEFIPLQTVGGKRVTSFTAGAVEAVGGLKMDFLVVSNIHDIMEAIQLVRERRGLVGTGLPTGILPHEAVPLPDRSGDAFVWDLPADPAVFADFAAGRTETVFQYHTDGARDWLKYFNRQRPDGRPLIDSIEDLAIFTALDRPGPLDIELVNPDVEGATHNALVEYTRRAAGKTPSPSIHPAVAKLVPETHGVMLYQEQLQRVYQDITGCTGPEAEEFRRNVAKKLKEKVDAVYPAFMERAAARLGSREDAQAVWETFATWGQYGFNASHATCYAVIGYACAWLKRNYHLEWWCGLLRHADKDKINTRYWKHISGLVDLPDVGKSGPKWEIQNERLRAPMSLLTGIGPSAHAQLCHYAPYKSVDDLADAIVKYREDHAAIAEAVAAAQAKIETEEVEASDQAEEPAEPGKVKTPRSPIHRTIVYNLAVAGALRSLFDDDLPAEEQLAAFDNAMLERVGSKYRATMKRTFPTLDAVGRYQLTKKVLAPYGADLREMLPGDLPSFLSRDGDRLYYQWTAWDRDERCEVTVEDPVMDRDTATACAEATVLPDGGFRVAVLLYVEDVRLFRWGAGKSSEAMELVVDVGGGKMQVTRWPAGQDGKLADRDKTGLRKGAVVAAVLQRNRADKPFSIRAYDVVRAPYDPKEE